MKKIFYLLIIVVFASCKFDGKAQDNKDIKTDEKCNGYYGERYMDFFNEWSINRENKKIIDSTLYYLDKQIICNPKDIEFVQEKAMFLIYNKFYERALIEIDSISKVDPFFKMMKGTIALRLNKENSEELLKEAYGEFIQYTIEYNDPNDIAWKIVLDNYFKGKEYALDAITKSKQNTNDDYVITTFEVMEQMIKEMPKEEILYNLFKIE
jgi:hypothetical protein